MDNDKVNNKYIHSRLTNEISKNLNYAHVYIEHAHWSKNYALFIFDPNEMTVIFNGHLPE